MENIAIVTNNRCIKKIKIQNVTNTIIFKTNLPLIGTALFRRPVSVSYSVANTEDGKFNFGPCEYKEKSSTKEFHLTRVITADYITISKLDRASNY